MQNNRNKSYTVRNGRSRTNGWFEKYKYILEANGRIMYDHPVAPDKDIKVVDIIWPYLVALEYMSMHAGLLSKIKYIMQA